MWVRRGATYAGGLDAQVTEESLLALFSTFGDINDIQLPKETDHGTCVFIHHAATKHRGYAFITFTQEDDADDAMDNMNLNEVHGVCRDVLTPECHHSERGQGTKDSSERHAATYLGDGCTFHALTVGLATGTQHSCAGRPLAKK